MVIHWAIPVFALSLALEAWWSSRDGPSSGRPGYSWRDTLCSLSLGIGNVLLGLFTGELYLGFMMQVWELRVFDLGLGAGVLALCFLIDDLQYYWRHRLGHKIRWAWCAHVTHHSSQHYNLSTALRQPWTNLPTGMFLLSVPMVLVGFHPAMVLFCQSIGLLYQYWIHTEYIEKTPIWFEFVFNTPSHHRAHHGRNPRYLDSNYGGVLILWDRLFGTFVAEDATDPVEYGLVKNLRSYSPLVAAFHAWLEMFKDASQGSLSPRQRLMYLFGPPGWSHDGSRLTSRQIKVRAGI